MSISNKELVGILREKIGELWREREETKKRIDVSRILIQETNKSIQINEELLEKQTCQKVHMMALLEELLEGDDARYQDWLRSRYYLNQPRGSQDDDTSNSYDFYFAGQGNSPNRGRWD